ncbi:MAG: DEAD/DEAH box helicase [Actinobacteria bacterium HGW-Actinobacteria-6]|jgi:type III restriction enzyme|nr:MAG: DEAD/DEAH box helicase [Actinobacteria bacterium HGW-Actinobacteria-6]
MQFKFDADQEFQLRAINSVADLFQGQGFVSAGITFGDGSLGLAAVANRIDLNEQELVRNVRAVQTRSAVAVDDALHALELPFDAPEGVRYGRFLNFSIEMETGTGKTYVYLRTALELHRRYGMRKFIIVVPSVAVREGVIKTFDVTRLHFRELFDNVVYRYNVYDSANLTQVRQFAYSDSVEFLIMTIDSFNKAANIIRQSRDQLQGETPLHLIQMAKPVLILDEPQNFESEKSRIALASLDPLMALRYSATHRTSYNLVYRLTPYEAYQQGLVKRIEVDSVLKEGDDALPFVRLDEIRVNKTRIDARLTVHASNAGGAVRESTLAFKPGESLADRTGRREYQDFVIDEINPGWGTVVFSNGIELTSGAEIGSDKEALFEAQIRRTIDEHLHKQVRLRERGIKVLSLFFIDKVDNYAADNGTIRILFDRIFNELKVGHPEWEDAEPDQVRAAYFAEKRKRGGEIEMLDSSSGEAREDQLAYDAIMRDKEALLAFPSPDDDNDTRRKKQIAFIFSHSALREGWDNPNVFQICTLNQTSSQVKKRQEIGRGVRLAVDQRGERVHDERVNILTVIANESYRSYVQALQSEIASEYRAEIEERYGKSMGNLTDSERREIEDAFGEGILPPPPRKSGERVAHLRKQRALSPEFAELWTRISHKSRYAVEVDSQTLLVEALESMKLETVERPRITFTRAVVIADENAFIALQSAGARSLKDLSGRFPLPNVVELIRQHLEQASPPVRLSGRTLLDFIRRVDPAASHLLDSPHEFAAAAARCLRAALATQLVHGIKYQQTGEWFNMSRLLAEDEVAAFSKYVVESERSLYDLVPCDSIIESNFANAMEARDDVKVYLKLPAWFEVDTPVGRYRPDWAIVLDRDGAERVYLVTETKGRVEGELATFERYKVQCGRAHFERALEGVEYSVATTGEQVR